MAPPEATLIAGIRWADQALVAGAAGKSAP
jgi:hypothetical protein